MSGTVDEVMGVQHDVECSDNVHVHSSAAMMKLEAVCLYTVSVPEGHSNQWLCRPLHG